MLRANDLEKNLHYGKVEYGGKQYALIEDAYPGYDYNGNTYWTAKAVNLSDEPDEYGTLPVYVAMWPERDDYDEAIDTDEYACDWDNVYHVELIA